jgi:AcrR family transcriptional regulator
MASSSLSRAPSLHPDDWLRVAFSLLASNGIDAVRVEVLARKLGASKGSFYWHFRDRAELLEKMLARWEGDEVAWLEADSGVSAAARWARIVERIAQPDHIRTEVAVGAWARKDKRVANLVAAIEAKKCALIASVLREIGFKPSAAESWSQLVLLVGLGWIDRATRDEEASVAGRSLGELLSELVLAASVSSSAPNHEQ